jgi:hypothetical protein
MKKILYLAIFALPFFSFQTVAAESASSTPPSAVSVLEPSATLSQAPSQVSGQATIEELNAAIARAEAARQKADDFEGSAYFPSEWESAESRYADAQALPKAAGNDLRQAITAFSNVADAYDSIFNLTIPLYAQAREDEIMAIWDELVAAGARDSFPEFFTPADETAILAYSQYEAADYYSARDSAAKALEMYQALKVANAAWQVRSEIVKKNFESYSPDDFERADGISIAVGKYYEAGDFPSAQENAGEALQEYQSILAAGWKAYAEQHSLSAGNERQNALDNKANIATRDLFNQAETRYRSAGVSLGSRNYEEAANQFINAESMFIAATNSTIEKRNNAAEAILEANERIIESDETARQAEIIMEGGSR